MLKDITVKNEGLAHLLLLKSQLVSVSQNCKPIKNMGGAPVG